ncbi:hypothetical protein [Shewanella spartinae]|uniref:hypothetical protein n=1 Tax=Shewanella spartinae TaxID=2864205 RepID=UPI001C6607E4|nr:hypothetical protein [Shewanella spartinae]QYJ95075.1 hypothetical protein K0I31_06745 [Shewanella spartinae]
MDESSEQNKNPPTTSSATPCGLSKAQRILSGEESTKEFESYSNAMRALDKYIKGGDRYGAENASQEEQLKILAKDPDGLELLDESNKAIAKVFSALSQLVIKALDIQPDPEKVKLVASSKTISELLINIKPVLGILLEDFKGVRPIIYIEGDEDSDENIQRFNLLKSAIACHLGNLPEQSTMFFDQLWGKVLGQENPNSKSLREEILKVQGVIESAKSYSKKGEPSRHSKNRQRKDYAISLYRKKSYQNPSQARITLYTAIAAYAKDINHPFSSEYQGMQTVYKWFLEEERIKNKLS